MNSKMFSLVALVAALLCVALASPNANAADTMAPSAPTNVAATAVTATSARITWTAATDNVGVAWYSIPIFASWDWTFGSWVTAPTTNADLTGLTCNTTYKTKVTAMDAAWNSSTSGEIAFMTAACPVGGVGVSITAPVADAVLTTTNNVNLSFATTGSPTSITCKLDSGAAVACSSPTTYSALSPGAHTLTVSVANATSSASAIRSFNVNTGSAAGPSGESMPVGHLSGWIQTMTEDFSRDQVEGDPRWHSSHVETDFVYEGAQTNWTSYKTDYYDTYNGRPYRGDQVLSVKDGVLRFHLRAIDGQPAGASIAPILSPGSYRPLYQTYGRFSIRARLRDAQGAIDQGVPNNLGNYKVAWMLWPHWSVEQDDWFSAESDFPEGGLGPGDLPEGFHHYKKVWDAGAQKYVSITEPKLTMPGGQTFRGWHTYTQEWRPRGCPGSPPNIACRSYYIDGNFVGSTQQPAYTREERWQIQTETETLPGEFVDLRQEGYLEVDWAVAYKDLP